MLCTPVPWLSWEAKWRSVAKCPYGRHGKKIELEQPCERPSSYPPARSAPWPPHISSPGRGLGLVLVRHHRLLVQLVDLAQLHLAAEEAAELRGHADLLGHEVPLNRRIVLLAPSVDHVDELRKLLEI